MCAGPTAAAPGLKVEVTLVKRQQSATLLLVCRKCVRWFSFAGGPCVDCRRRSRVLLLAVAVARGSRGGSDGGSTAGGSAATVGIDAAAGTLTENDMRLVGRVLVLTSVFLRIGFPEGE